MDHQRLILPIAIDKYKDSTLPTLNNAKIDTERFINVITEKYGFEIFKEALFDQKATRNCILERLNTLSTESTPEDEIIIYFAGHGTINQKTKKGYWIPYDANGSIGDYIPNSSIIDAIEGIDAKHILLISDSCFSGTFLSQTRAGRSNSYHKLSQLKSRWVLSSGRVEVVSDGPPGVGSPFAVSLNKYLENNNNQYFSAVELFVAVQKETGSLTNQQPIFAHLAGVGHENGQLVFQLVSRFTKNKSTIIDTEISKIVVPFEISQELKKIGLSQNSIFGYYESENQPIVKKVDGTQGFLCSAFLFDEIAVFIPDEIEIDKNTLLARFDGWDQPTESDLEFPLAEVTYQRTWASDNPYMAICRFNGRMVAFSKTEDGKYNNLIRWGRNQAETAALMLLALFNEKKIKLEE